MHKQEQYPKELFHLIVEYAKKKSEILDIDLLESIKLYTPIYYLIGNHDWEFKEDSIYWKEFVQRYEKGEDLVELVNDMYIRNDKAESSHKWYGCFRYKYVEDENGIGTVKLHFLNNRSSKEGPLSSTQTDKRLEELKEMFKDIKKNHPNVKYVEGGSWLYNIEAYKRLFPREYTEKMRSIPPKTNNLVIWGQFINSEWSIKDDYANKFLSRVKKAKSKEDLENSFEMLSLFPKAEIKYFYNLYSII